MARYKITYTRTIYDAKTNQVKSQREYTVIRHAETAADAVAKLCDQYGWRADVNLIDADTCGHTWASVDVFAPDYGCWDWLFRALAELDEG